MPERKLEKEKDKISLGRHTTNDSPHIILTIKNPHPLSIGDNNLIRDPVNASPLLLVSYIIGNIINYLESCSGWYQLSSNT